MPHHTIAIVNSDPALLGLLDALLTETNYTVRTYLTVDTTYPALQQLQPDLIILDVGMQASAAGWPLLKLLQFDPTTMHIPVLVSTVDHQFVRNKADFLETKGYRVLELPASFVTLANVVRDILEPAADDVSPLAGAAGDPPAEAVSEPLAQAGPARLIVKAP
jgi:DNA-binding response OmpR family regulator